MRIFMWSGPRNISTALLRSFSNRDDTSVYDEPFYAYYLKETGLEHPMKEEILNKYSFNENEVIETILKDTDKIYYQKHMTHHILDKTNLEWLNKGINCFLLRHPEKVINSYIKKNELNNLRDIGFEQQYKLFNYVKKNVSKNIIVINSEELLKNPKDYLSKLCGILKIKFTNKMLMWEKGNIKDFGIWYKHWYSDILNSTSFKFPIYKNYDLPKKYKKIYEESREIYETMNNYSIKL